MKLTKVLPFLLLIMGLGLSACGGGGGGGIASIGGGGIGGTGVTSTGTIDGFGSIFVNGVEYETGNSEVSLDGQSTSEGSLRLGMVVTVRGTLNDDGKTGTAEQVIFDDEVQGPVSSIEPGLDGDSLLLTVLGVKVIVERTGTVFDDVTFDTLAVGDLVEVSGFVEGALQIRATRIEKKSIFVPGTSEVERKGIVSGLTANTFNLGSFLVDYSGADLSDVPGGTLTEGMSVEVHGTLTDNLITASRVEEEDDITDDFDDEDEVSVQGAITNFVDLSSFTVNGVNVDASGASIEPSTLVLANGVVVEVEGAWNGTTLVAEEVKARRGRIELEAKVASVSAEQRSITLQYFAGSVTVLVDSRTQIDDDTGEEDSLTLADIASGDFLEVEASRAGDTLVASRVRREDTDDDILQAPVDSFNAGVDITVLGITFSTVGAQFESRDDDAITAEDFFAQLQVGDLVKVRDDEQADGVADEVEFEDDGLDGDEFDDDCDDSGSDDDCESDDDDCDSDGSSDDCDSDDECDDDSGSDGDCESTDDDCDDSGTGGDCESDDDDCDSSVSGGDCESDDAGCDDSSSADEGCEMNDDDECDDSAADGECQPVDDSEPVDT
jgi:hypothetical protein